MISRFRLRDFKGHRDTELELGRFTMLVGDNASGKTSVLEALGMQGHVRSFEDPSFRAAFHPQDLLRRGSGGAIQFSSQGAPSGVSPRARFELQTDPATFVRRDARWELHLVVTSGPNERVAVVDHLGRGDLLSSSDEWEAVCDQFSLTLGRAGFFRLRAEEIAASAYGGRPEAEIEADGRNTAVALSAMKLGNDEAFQRVEDAMRRLIPSVERVRLRPATVHQPGLGDVVGSKVYFDFRGASGIPADGASHGTLIVLALLAILHGANRPNLILLDDFDHALHPRAQMELVRMIKDLLTLQEFHDVQVVATTHSPYVLDELDPSGVYAFALRDDGTVASKRLSEHPDAEKTRGSLKAGQLWSLDPERDWVLKE